MRAKFRWILIAKTIENSIFELKGIKQIQKLKKVILVVNLDKN